MKLPGTSSDLHCSGWPQSDLISQTIMSCILRLQFLFYTRCCIDASWHLHCCLVLLFYLPTSKHTHIHTPCLHTVSIAMLAERGLCSVVVSDSSLQSVQIWRAWSRQQLIVAQVVGVQCALVATRRRRNVQRGGGTWRVMCDMCQISFSPLLSFIISCWASKESWQKSQRLSLLSLLLSGGQTRRRWFYFVCLNGNTVALAVKTLVGCSGDLRCGRRKSWLRLRHAENKQNRSKGRLLWAVGALSCFL